MGKGVRRFVDKRTATTYALMAAPTRDESAGDGGGGAGGTGQGGEGGGAPRETRVFVRTDARQRPSPLDDPEEDEEDEEWDEDDEAALEAMAQQGGAGPEWWRAMFAPEEELSDKQRGEMKDLGLPDDGYNYLRHLRQPSGEQGPGVTFVPVSGPVAAPQRDVRVFDVRAADEPEDAAAALPVASSVHVAARGTEKVVCSALEEVDALLRDDVSEAGSTVDPTEWTDSGRGTLEDDFVAAALAGGEPLGPDDDLDGWLGGGLGGDEDLGPPMPRGALPASTRPEPPERAGPAGILDAKFERLALEYSDDELGELDEDDETTRGRADVSDFAAELQLVQPAAAGEGRPRGEEEEEEWEEDVEQEDGGGDPGPRGDVADEGEPRPFVYFGKQGDAEEFSLEPQEELVGMTRRMIEDQERREAERAARPRAETERVEIVERDEWDCETIVSTYSNLENHPGLLKAPPSRRKKKPVAPPPEPIPEDNEGPATQIRLAANGFPVDYMPRREKAERGAEGDSDDEGEDDDELVDDEWRSNITRRGETAEEKKARKAAVKEGRRAARAAKKSAKTTFKAMSASTSAAPAAGALRPGTSAVPL